MSVNEPRFEVFPEKPYAEGDIPAEPEYTGPTGRFVWHFKDANGRITFIGGESFTRREDAHRSIREVAADVLVCVYGYEPVVAAAKIVFREHRGLLPIVDLEISERPEKCRHGYGSRTCAVCHTKSDNDVSLEVAEEKKRPSPRGGLRSGT